MYSDKDGEMNERIQELAEQAELNLELQSLKVAKFAELIVAECLDIVEDEDDGSMDTKAVRWAMIRIKKHFGVEE